MARFEFRSQPLEGLFTVHRSGASDERGFFSRLYCAKEFAAAGMTEPIDQINDSITRRRGAVRGMHFQNSPHGEIKLVTCLRGKVFDVAVDLRKNSPTFLHWHAQILSPDNMTSMLIPRGFAHGFQTLEDDCELVYLHTAPYDARAEGGVRPLDPALSISWPESVTDMSDRDRSHPLIASGFQGVAP